MKSLTTLMSESINDIQYSKILSNLDIVKDSDLTNKLIKLSHNISGGIKAVWLYPNENVSTVVIAYDNNEPIGVITLTDGDQNIYVNPSYRNNQIASKLKDIIYKRK